MFSSKPSLGSFNCLKSTQCHKMYYQHHKESIRTKLCTNRRVRVKLRHLKISIFQEKQKTIFFPTPQTFVFLAWNILNQCIFYICKYMLVLVSMKPPRLVDNNEYVLMSPFVVLFLQNQNRHHHLSRFARSES